MYSVSNYSQLAGDAKAPSEAGMIDPVAVTAGKKMASWSDLDEYAVYLYQLDAAQAKQRIKEAQKKMHQQLDDQVDGNKWKLDYVKDEDKK